MSRVIGEGAYGCVLKPSIKCKNKDKQHSSIDYTNRVSKIMTSKNATDELKDFLVINKIDPHFKYHLETPILCKPTISKTTIEDLKKCKNISYAKVLSDPNDYKILVYPYGGQDLNQFCKNGIYDFINSPEVDANICTFWIEVLHLFKGLELFKKKNIIHYDIKPQNILFDPNTLSLKFIDFGLMQMKQDIIDSSSVNNNKLGIYHWSYPMETGIMNKNQFLNVTKKTADYFIEFENAVLDRQFDMQVFKFKSNKIPTYDNYPYIYINYNKSTMSKKIHLEKTLDKYYEGIHSILKTYNNEYLPVLNRIIDGIDIFGLGFSLKYILNCFKKNNSSVVTQSFYDQCSELFAKMYDQNLNTRLTNLTTIMNEYIKILDDNNILKIMQKLNYSVDKQMLDSFANRPVYNSATIMLPQTSAKICTNNKELNPDTHRCVNKCKANYSRNDKFKCVKNKTIKTLKPKSFTKSCVDSKELNPDTYRCVNKCKANYSRNDKFKCVKNKTNKYYSTANVRDTLFNNGIYLDNKITPLSSVLLR